jgi:flagellar biosynthesis GTPase FlhF
METIIHKLDQFIRKYHFSLLVKNTIFFVGFLLLVILFFSLVEYSLWLSTAFRGIIFFLFVFSVFFSGVWYLLLPFLKISKYNKRINRYKAADIIGDFFPEIKDKFRNLLELNDLSNVSREKTQLVEAAILQKTKNLSIFQMHKALNLSRLKRAGFLLLPVLLGFFMLTFTKPEIVKDSFERILLYNTEFERPAPFNFIVTNQSLTGIQGDAETIELRFEGDRIPPSATVFINNNAYPMQKTGIATHQYTIRQLKENFTFYFEANGYNSGVFQYSVITRPSILHFTTELIYPAYTGKQNEVKKNATDFLVPQGTKIKWTFRAKDVEKIMAIYNNKTEILKSQKDKINIFDFSKIFISSENISFSAANQFVQNSDSLNMFIDVVPDNFPAIIIDEARDSLILSRMFFKGNISDDYGFTALKFHYKIKDQKEFTSIDIPFSQQITEQQFFYLFDFAEISQWREKEIEYFFTVTDNDAVNGRKTTKSQLRYFSMPDKQELKQTYEQKQENMMSEMMKGMQEVKQIQSEIDRLRFDFMNKKNLNWEDKNKFEQLLQKQEEMEKLLENMKEENIDKNLLEEFMKEMSPELLEKQRQLEEMFNQLFSEEMKEMMRQMQEMLQELNKENIMEHLEKMQMRSEDIEKMLDENLELFKQLEFEKKMEEVLDDLDKLREQLDKLNEATESKDQPGSELQAEQEEINNKFENLKEQIEDLNNMNKDLFDPMEFPDTEELSDEISEELQNAEENLSKNKNSQAGKNQKSGSEKMQKLSDMLQSAMEDHAMESLAEDIENLKMILKNLIHISFAQESNIELGKKLGPRDPKYNHVMVNQKRLMNRFKIVEDSLHALSKRQIMIQPIIIKDLSFIKENAAKISHYLNFGALAPAMTHQQYLMQSVNNLALLLIEAMEEMNDLMMQAQSQGGSCSKKKGMKCSKPGQGKPSAKSMRQLQEQLNQQMEQLMQQMKEGKGGMNMSEGLAKIAAEQEAIRRQLQQYSEMLRSMGDFDAKTLNEIMQQMEQTEKDLVNKRLDLHTMKRQNDILVRLMESEKAELEREKDDSRTSRTGKIINKSNPEDFFQYKRDKTTSEEIIKSIPPVFNSFYRQKVNNFYLELTN